MATFTQHQNYTPITIYDGDRCKAWCIQDGDIIYMANVWVHDDHRGNGVGMEMMADIRSYFKDYFITTDYTETSKGFWIRVKELGYVDEVVDYKYDFDWVFGIPPQP